VNPYVGFPQAAQTYNNSYTLQFVLPCGLIFLAPAPRGAVWILDQNYTDVAWLARLHTCEILADFAYKMAVNASYQRIIYLPTTNDGKLHISSLMLLTLEAPVSRNLVGRFDIVNTAQVIPPEQTGRFLEHLHMLAFTENSLNFRGGPINETPSNHHPYVGASTSTRQVQQATQPTH
ncbi:hypothetical protein CPB85DRAFT_1336634, partial [Mucidula mucida]